MWTSKKVKHVFNRWNVLHTFEMRIVFSIWILLHVNAYISHIWICKYVNIHISHGRIVSSKTHFTFLIWQHVSSFYTKTGFTVTKRKVKHCFKYSVFLSLLPCMYMQMGVCGYLWVCACVCFCECIDICIRRSRRILIPLCIHKYINI